MNHRMGFPAVLKALDTDSFDDFWSQSQRYPLGTPRRVSAPLVLPAVVVARFKALDDFERKNFDKPLNQAVAPTVAPSVRPVAEPASTREFRVGDRVRNYVHAGTVMDVCGVYARIAFDSGDWSLDSNGWAPCFTSALELIPAQREQVASPSVRQHDSKGEGTTALDGEWVEHDGGPCPVDGKTLVAVRLRSGEEHSCRAAAGWGENSEWGGSNWSTQWSVTPHDIVAYRVVK